MSLTRSAAALAALLLVAPAPGGTAAAATAPKEHDVAEPSSAVAELSPVTPENLFVGSTPSAVDEKSVLYGARQWMDGALPGTPSIWRSPFKGGAATRLLAPADGEWLVSPRSAPAASSLYFAVNGAIFGTAKNGVGGRRKLPASGYHDYAPIPFPDDRRLLFTSCTQGRDCYFQDGNYIWTVNADGSELTQLRQGRDAQVSPDGKRIAFSYKGDLWIMDADGSGVTVLTPGEAAVDTQPTFTPDGKRIVFTRLQTDAPVRQTDLWMIDADGKNPVRLTASPAEDVAPFAGPDGFVYFLSNRGPLVGGQYPSRIWRLRIVEPAAPAAAAAPVPPPASTAVPPPAPAAAPATPAPAPAAAPAPATPAGAKTVR